MANMSEDTKYCVTFQLPERGTMSGSVFFQYMSDVLIGLEELNLSLVTGLHSEITVVSFIEEIEQGSIKVWLRDILRKTTDDDIRDLTSSFPLLPFFLIKLKPMILRCLGADQDTLLKEGTMETEVIKALEKYHKDNPADDFLQAEKWDQEGTKKAASKIITAASHIPKVTMTSDTETQVIRGDYHYGDIDECVDDAPLTNRTIRWLTVHKPELDKHASKWTFLLDNRSITVDISTTAIAQDTMIRGEVRVGDCYKVQLEEIQYLTKSGQHRMRYRILEVLEFKRGRKQTTLI